MGTKQQNIAVLFKKAQLKQSDSAPKSPKKAKLEPSDTEPKLQSVATTSDVAVQSSSVKHKEMPEKKTVQKLSAYDKVDLPDSPNQPDNTSEIPPHIRISKGVKVTDPFRAAWFEKWSWLHYVPHLSAVICYTCAKAHQNNLIDLCKNSDPAFICKGFQNWTKATVKFSSHENSRTHKQSVMALVQKTSQPVSHLINSKSEEDHQIAIQWLKTLFTSIQFLARQCIAIRGHSVDRGNLQQLLLTRCRDSPAMMGWLNKKTNWTSPIYQNEILNMFSHSIIRQLISDIVEAGVFSVIMDGTQDISGEEQESVCIRYVDDNFVSHEVFVGFYKANGTTGQALSNILKDILLRLGLDIKYLRFQTYDGASNMTGKENGCQAIMKKSQPLALYVHCGPHVTNLVAKFICNDITEIRNALKHIQDLGEYNSINVLFIAKKAYSHCQD